MHNRYTAVALITVLATGPCLAAPTDQDAIVVTATRTAQAADESLASVTVITRHNIEQSQAKTLPELLRGIPGVDLTVSGGYGKQTSLFLRGTNSDHTLVMIDGVKIGSATAGLASWELLPVSQIERIEIVRGPRSSLYGSEAIGGVIQIFTRHGMDRPEAHATASTGSYKTRAVSAGMSTAQDGTDLSMTAARFKTGGLNAQQPIPGPYGIDEPDKDGYWNDSVTARLRHHFDGGAEIDTHLFRAQGHTDYDGNYQNQTNFVQQAVGADLSISPTNNWRVKLRAGQSQDDSENFKDRTFSSSFNTQRNTASWQNDVTLEKNQLLTLGADHQTDRVISTTAYTTDRRNDTGIYGQIQSQLDKNDVLIAARQDDNDAFGKYNTGNAAWGYALSNTLRLTAAYGTAFKAPSFNQLYYPGFGNPDLRPEESKSLEAGLHGKQTWGSWDVHAYQTDIDHLIATVCNTTTWVCSAENVNEARIRGLETQLSATLAGWQSGLGLSVIDPRDVGTGHVLPRRTKQALKLDTDRAFGRAHFGVTWLAQGRRYDDAANTVEVGGYGLVNLRAQYDMSKDWQLRGNIENAFNKAYQTINTFNSPGRGYFLTLAYQPRSL